MGAGDGKVEIPVLQKLVSQRGSVDNLRVLCVDPDEKGKAQFLDKLGESGLGDVNVEYHAERFDDHDFGDEKFDFVLANQAFQYIGHNQARTTEELVRFKSLIAERGLVAIVMLTSKGDVTEVRRMLSCAMIVGGTEKRIDWGADTLGLYASMAKIPYTFTRFPWQLDISSWFEGHTGELALSEAPDVFNPDIDGKSLLSFLGRESWDDIQEREKEWLIRSFPLYIDPEDLGRKKITGHDDCMWLTDLEPISGSAEFHPQQEHSEEDNQVGKMYIPPTLAS